MSSENIEIVLATLQNMNESINRLIDWNKDVTCADEWPRSSMGMQLLSADCMLLQAIGEAVKQIEKRAGVDFLNQCPDIPWQEIKSMRNHIAHGYFQIDVDYVFSTIKTDLVPLQHAVTTLINVLTKTKNNFS